MTLVPQTYPLFIGAVRGGGVRLGRIVAWLQAGPTPQRPGESFTLWPVVLPEPAGAPECWDLTEAGRYAVRESVAQAEADLGEAGRGAANVPAGPPQPFVYRLSLTKWQEDPQGCLRDARRSATLAGLSYVMHSEPIVRPAEIDPDAPGTGAVVELRWEPPAGKYGR